MNDDESNRDFSGDASDTARLAAALQRAMADQSRVQYVLTLYVTGMTPRSQRAIDNVQRLCGEYLPGRYELKIVDIYQQPAMAEADQIIAAPTLVKRLPEPLRRLIGDMSDEGRVLVAMGIKVPDEKRAPSGAGENGAP